MKQLPTLLALLAFGALGLSPLRAADRTWNGLGTNNNFTSASNWNATVAPGDALFFGGGTRLAPDNDFPAGTAFTNLTFNSGAGAFVITGNWVTLTGSITNNQPSGAETLGLAMLLPVNPPFISVVSNGTLNLAGSLSGASGFTKTGPGRLTLRAANVFTGAVNVAQGTLRVDHNAALGLTNGATTISSGATLDLAAPTLGLNGLDLGNEQIFVSGPGVNGQGAIMNPSTGGSQINALQKVTLTGDTTFGGSGPWTFSGSNPGRWDIRGTPPTAFLSTGGQPYNLTKTGSNEVRLAGVTVDPALVNIEIQQGALALEGNTTSLGNPTGTVTVRPGATLEFDSLTNRVNKRFVLIGDGLTASVDNRVGNNTLLGPITLSNDCVFLIRGNGTTLTNRGSISGPGGLIKSGGASGVSVLALAGTNTYTGNTLALVGNGSIANSPNIILSSGATLDVSGRVDGMLRIEAGQTLSGSGTVRGSITNLGEAHLLPGTTNATGTLDVFGDVWTGGGYTTIIPFDAVTNGWINATGTIHFSGQLLLLHYTAEPLAYGRLLKVFNAADYRGAFSSIVSDPPLPAGFVWDATTLDQNGTLQLIAAPPALTFPPTAGSTWCATEVLNRPPSARTARTKA